MIKADKIVRVIIIILFTITLGLSTLNVGHMLNEISIFYINCTLSIFSIIYIIIIKFSNKEKFIINKLDIVVLTLCLSSIIPLIFKTYVNLGDTIETIQKYINVFCIYIITKDMVKSKKKAINYILNIIILIAIILVLIGMDKITTNICTPFFKAIGSIDIDYEEIRLDSILGYPNSLAAIISLALILSITQYLNCESKIKKCLYSIAIFILETGLILTYSRIMYIVMIIIALIYFLLIKEKRLNFITITIMNGIIGIIYANIFMGNIINLNFSVIWYILIATIGISILISIIDKYLVQMLEQITIKKICVTIFIFLILGITLLNFALKSKCELIVAGNNNDTTVIRREFYNLKGNKHYDFAIDIIAKTKYDKTSIFEIEIIEKNKYFDTVKNKKIEFGNYEGIKEIEIITDEDTEQIFIDFKILIANEDNVLKINNLRINKEEVIINYKYLPYELVSKIKNINLKTKSAWERFEIIEDSLQIASKNWLFGIGGNGWNYEYPTVQDYLYNTIEPHSYITQLWLEFGIVGILSYIIIFIILIREIAIKRTSNKQAVGILCAILCVAIHSIVDFDMSFYFILVIVYICIGVLSSIIEEKDMNQCKYRHIYGLINFILILIVLNNIFKIQYNKKFENLENNDYYAKLNVIEEYKKKLPEYRKLKQDKYDVTQFLTDNEDLLRTSKEDVLINIKNYETEVICLDLIKIYLKNNEQEKIELIYNEIQRRKESVNFRPRQAYRRYMAICEIVELLEQNNIYEYIDMFKRLRNEEYNNTKEIIKDYKKARITREESEKYLKILETYNMQ